jgi:hypothetical protein
MKVKLPSGAELVVTPLDWEDAWDISQRVLAVIEKLELDLKGINWTDIQSQDVLNFKGPICQILSSKVVFDAAKDCFKKCTYAGMRIDNATFNDSKARGDMLIACFHALKENCAPFFGSLLSGLKAP